MTDIKAFTYAIIDLIDYNIIIYELLYTNSHPTEMTKMHETESYGVEGGKTIHPSNPLTRMLTACVLSRVAYFGPCEHYHWRIRGGAASTQPPNRIQFFHFCICFCQKAPTSEVGAPQRLGTPPTGNPGSATDYSVNIELLFTFFANDLLEVTIILSMIK